VEEIRIDFVKKELNDEKQIVYGEVYAPGVVDTDGDAMSEEDIEKMAHDFMLLASKKEVIDTNHDEIPNGAYPVESYIAKEGDPKYTKGAWVLGVKIIDENIWKKVKRGEINGYSFQAMVQKRPVYAEVKYDIENFTITEYNLNHAHFAYLELDKFGNIVFGVTDKEFGHFHEIFRNDATEMEEIPGLDNSLHAHRLNYSD
jgi:hypothetical protein